MDPAQGALLIAISREFQWFLHSRERLAVSKDSQHATILTVGQDRANECLMRAANLPVVCEANRSGQML